MAKYKAGSVDWKQQRKIFARTVCNLHIETRMYQFDSPYDQEVPHMYPQVKHCFLSSLLENALTFPHFGNIMFEFTLGSFLHDPLTSNASPVVPQSEIAVRVKIYL